MSQDQECNCGDYIDLTEEDKRLEELRQRRTSIRETFQQLLDALAIEEDTWLYLCYADANMLQIEKTQDKITQLSACVAMFAAAYEHITAIVNELVGFIAAVEWDNDECYCFD